MHVKHTLIIITSLAIYPFQSQASLFNGGFENGLTNWQPLTENLGFVASASSYTDGITQTVLTPTEGSFFLNLWGNNDFSQEFSWSIGDQLSFDWTIASGTSQHFDAGIFAINANSG